MKYSLFFAAIGTFFGGSLFADNAVLTGITEFSFTRYTGTTSAVNLEIGGVMMDSGPITYFLNGPGTEVVNWDARTQSVHLDLAFTSPLISTIGPGYFELVLNETGLFLSHDPLVDLGAVNQIGFGSELFGGGVVNGGLFAGTTYNDHNFFRQFITVDVAPTAPVVIGFEPPNGPNLYFFGAVDPGDGTNTYSTPVGVIQQPGQAPQSTQGTALGTIVGVPEPSSITTGLAILGLCGFGFFRRNPVKSIS